MEDGACQFIALAQFRRVCQIAIVAQREGALQMVDQERLSIRAVLRSRGSVAAMPYRHLPVIDCVQPFLIEHLCD